MINSVVQTTYTPQKVRFQTFVVSLNKSNEVEILGRIEWGFQAALYSKKIDADIKVFDEQKPTKILENILNKYGKQSLLNFKLIIPKNNVTESKEMKTNDSHTEGDSSDESQVEEESFEEDNEEISSDYYGTTVVNPFKKLKS